MPDIFDHFIQINDDDRKVHNVVPKDKQRLWLKVIVDNIERAEIATSEA